MLRWLIGRWVVKTIRDSLKRPRRGSCAKLLDKQSKTPESLSKSIRKSAGTLAGRSENKLICEPSDLNLKKTREKKQVLLNGVSNKERVLTIARAFIQSLERTEKTSTKSSN